MYRPAAPSHDYYNRVYKKIFLLFEKLGILKICLYQLNLSFAADSESQLFDNFESKFIKSFSLHISCFKKSYFIHSLTLFVCCFEHQQSQAACVMLSLAKNKTMDKINKIMI